MNCEDWRRAYEPLPKALEGRVASALRRLDEPATPRRLSLRTAVIALALLLALCGVAYAVYESITANLFGWFYGGNWKQEMQSGDVAPMGQSRRVGDVVYTIEEMVYKSQGEMQGLYGVVRMTPAKGANVVLLPEELNVNDPAGYVLHYGDVGQTITDDAPSYAELAAQRGAKILLPRVDLHRLMADGADYSGCYGSAWLPQEDGSVLLTLEMTDGTPRTNRYELTLELSNWEVTPEGYWLRDEPDSTLQTESWVVTVTPDNKEE